MEDTGDTFVVTGGAGFIGCNFVRLALRRGVARVVVLDKLTYAGHQASLEDVASHAGYTFELGDIADRERVEDILRRHRPTAIVNFAAESHVDRSIDGPRAFVRTNIQGTFELLDAGRQYLSGLSPGERERFRFLQVSTDEVYGSLGPAGAFSEATRYAPSSPYAASKAAADHLVRAYHHTFGLPALITNCSNNYGPFQFPEKLIPLAILNALEGRELPIYGDGGNIRDWLHVEDHCRAVLLVLEKGRPGEKYNIGGSNERTNLEVVDAICEALEKLVPAAENPRLRERGIASYKELKTFVADRPGHDRRYAIDAGKVRRDLGWSPEYGFQEGIESTVRWYLENREWCERVQRDTYGRERLGLGKGSARP